MALGDDAQILQLPLKAQGVKADDWAAVRASDLTALNAILRNMQEAAHKLSGRGGDSAIRSGLTVSGGITGANLTLTDGAFRLGSTPFTSSDPSFAPEVEASLTPLALDHPPLLGAVADILSPTSPFTWALSEHFIGGGVTGLGDLGELGWSTLNTPAVSFASSEANHPGILTVSTNANPLTALTLGTDILQSDLSYMGWVVRLVDTNRTQLRVGFCDTASAGSSAIGAYFNYTFPGAAPQLWETVTRSGAGVLLNTTDVPAVGGEWVLLEIVFSPTAVDFFINRERMFRHTGVSVDPATSVFIASVQEQGPSDTAADYDRVVVCGRGINKIWD